MKPASFDYHRPQTVQDAVGLLARFGESAKPIAGGQSLGPMLNMRLARPEHLIDLNDLVELDFVRAEGGFLEIGAMTRHHRVATSAEIRQAHPLLAAAAATIGHYPIRQRGTLGGSLVHADPAAQLPLIAALSGARIVLCGPSGPREAAAHDFFRSVMTVDLRHGEMICAVRFPKLAPDTGWGFELFSRRRGDFAIVAVAVTLRLDEAGEPDVLDMALGGVGSVPLRLDLSRFARAGDMPTAGWIADVAAFVARTVEPEDNALVPADFRREVAGELARKALAAAVARAREAME
ncbi:MAG: FAD binding domain-containing protein [Oricola sp.]